MKFSRILAISRKQFLALSHDPRTVVLMIFAPIMAMLIFGFVFGSETKHVPTLVVNLDQGVMANEFINNIDHEILKITSSHDISDAKKQVQDGKEIAAIIFPENFSRDVLLQIGNPSQASNLSKNTQVEIFIDTTNQQFAQAVLKELAMTGQKLAQSKYVSAAISFNTIYAFPKSKEARYIDYFVPGIMAFAITMFTTLLTLLSFVGERTSGTLDRLRITPVTETEIVLGYEFTFGIIAAIQGLLVLAVGFFVYHVLIVGSVALAAFLVVLTAIDAQAIGILVSAAAKQEGQAVQFLPFIIFPVFLLSGIFVPIQNLPGWLQPFSYILPPTWSIEALRDVLLRGWGLEQVWLHLLILAGFAVVFSALAILGLRRSRS